jgi:hypothetical protein
LEGAEFPEERPRKVPWKAVLVLGVAIAVGAVLLWDALAREPLEEEEEEGVEGVPARRGLLPTWATGDSWTYVSTAGHSFTLTVDGETSFEDTPCYRLTGTIDPPLEEQAQGTTQLYTSIRRLYAKSTLAVVEETVGNAENSRTTYFRRTLPENLWPLSENVEFTEEVQVERRGVIQGKVWQDPPASASYEVSVGRSENLTVQGVTFECFRISRRTPQGALVEERWYSDLVRNFVKVVDHRTGENVELSSYAVS